MTVYRRLTEDDIAHLRALAGPERVLTDEEVLINHSHDYTEDLSFLPEVVVEPETAEQVAAILGWCNENLIPVTARGAGTGLSGGALPIEGGIILSTRRLSRILNIDTANFQATVEPGVINQALDETLREYGLFYPPDPASRGSCSLGGNVAHSSGGPRAVKYGTTRDYILNLQVALPTGELIWTGASTLKYSTGYNLTQLMVGSEGTLGIVTKIVVKLLPRPQQRLLMLASFREAIAACEVVNKIFLAGITPSALEFMERDAILYTMPHVKDPLPLGDEVAAQLLIEVDGNNREVLYEEAGAINELLEKAGATEVLFADSDFEQERLWALRRKIGEAIKSHSIYKEEDAVVPRARLPQLLREVKKTGQVYGFRTVCYGHAGDGNLHINILRDSLSDDFWLNEIKKAIREIFLKIKEMGGTLSGEHGIGYVQREFMDIMFSEGHIRLMQGIKDAFDPNGILNPNKIWLREPLIHG